MIDIICCYSIYSISISSLERFSFSSHGKIKTSVNLPTKKLIRKRMPKGHYSHMIIDHFAEIIGIQKKIKGRK